MASELTPQSIRDVRFREKLRGYHPEDVDAFVASVAATVEALHRRLAELEAAPRPEVFEQPSGEQTQVPSDVEESLRRTLVLAQRTADMAVKEAQEEAERLLTDAQARREAVLTDAEALRARTMAELENELSSYRQRLHDERDALQRDVAALHTYVSQERERLRIYFSEQLQRVEEGTPSIETPPTMEGPAEPTTLVADAPVVPADEVDAPSAEGGVSGDEARADEADADEVAAAPVEAAPPAKGDDEDDPFLAELRRAVDDEAPLGPREDEPDLPPRDERDFNIFNDEEGGGRFLRRRR